MRRQHFQLMVLALLLSGCQSGLSYRATDLPVEFAARPTFSGQQFDLALLGNSGAGADLIQPRDALQVTVSSGNDEDTPLELELNVAENGTIDVPYVGAVHVAGMTESQATDAVRDASVQRRVFVRPSVAVLFSKKHMHNVVVSGAVQKPGKYEIRASASTLATAVLAAGGLTEKASSRITVHSPGGNTVGGRVDDAGQDLILRAGHESERAASARPDHRAGAQITQVSLLAPDSTRIASQQNLPNGTVITVQEQPARYVTVMGLTGNRNIEMPYDREYRLLDALAQAGGPRFSPWIANKLKILRPHPQTGETITIRINLGEAKRNREANIPLGSGDVVSVEETPLTFAVSTVSQLLGVGRSAVTAAAIP